MTPTYRKVGAICTQCATPCLKCSTTNNASCLSCDSSTSFLNGTTCVTVCPAGTYANIFAKKCVICSQEGC